MSKFTIDFFEFSFLVEACIPQKNNKQKDLEWKYIPNYEEIYAVNEYGVVISLNRIIIRKNGVKQFIPSKILEPVKDKKGYLVLLLSNCGETRSLKVHQIVAMTFLNHTPNGMIDVVDHIDNNKLNNHKTNLQIISVAENSRKEKKGKTSKYRGVHWSKEKKKWKTTIIHEKKSKHIGYFDNEYEASVYYKNAIIKISNGEFDNIIIKKRNKTSKYKGVSYSKNNDKWRGSFRYKNKFYSAGFFDNEDEAYKEYLKLYKEIKNE